jgi:hypothetical protein
LIIILWLFGGWPGCGQIVNVGVAGIAIDRWQVLVVVLGLDAAAYIGRVALAVLKEKIKIISLSFGDKQTWLQTIFFHQSRTRVHNRKKRDSTKKRFVCAPSHQILNGMKHGDSDNKKLVANMTVNMFIFNLSIYQHVVCVCAKSQQIKWKRHELQF